MLEPDTTMGNPKEGIDIKFGRRFVEMIVGQ
jgi:hypothetical protein